MQQPTILCVVGPTACGKTALAVALAKRFHGEVVSVDSMQIYRGLSIGTAAPTPEEMEGVPHHMVGVADPAESWSAARFTAAADRCVQDILRRGLLPVLAGGTGLYLDAIIAGRAFAPGSQGGAVRAQLERERREGGMEPLLNQLRQVDPESARRLHPADEKRILRALEVYRETGRTISEHNRETQVLPKKYRPLYIGLAYRDRSDLRAAIDQRVDRMVASGLLEEVRSLAERGVPESATAMQAIGYKELVGVLRGERSLEEAAEEVKLRSRQYAKRQLTWLRRNENIFWILWEKNRDFARALQIATDFLHGQGLQ